MRGPVKKVLLGATGAGVVVGGVLVQKLFFAEDRHARVRFLKCKRLSTRKKGWFF